MSQDTTARLHAITQAVAQAWVDAFCNDDPTLQPGADQLDEWLRDATALWRRLVDLWPQQNKGSTRLLPAEAIEQAGRLGAAWVHEGFLPSDAARFVLASRQGAAAVMEHDDALRPLLPVVGRLAESLALAVYESHGQSRERMIMAQSLSLIELSSPVIKLWDRILLLPLVGVIDTLRARAITERLLEAVVREEAEVTLIDVTGVPVLDTGVAGHLVKTVSAAEMLGTTVILTGISAEGAQTLVKLGVDLRGLNTRGLLRAGVSDAFARLGMQVVPAQASQPSALRSV